jgi:hypothetical protein
MRTLIFGIVVVLVSFMAQGEMKIGAFGKDNSTSLSLATAPGEKVAQETALFNGVRDYDLSFEFRTPKPARGAVVIRGHAVPMANGEVALYGYRIHLDTITAEKSGAIEETRRRGILAEPTKDIKSAIKPNDWNRVEIRTTGSLIEVTINGMTASRIRDEGILYGDYLAVQAFSDGSESALEFRNGIVYGNDSQTGSGEKPWWPRHWRDASWRNIYNGENLDGWKEWGSESWEIVDGVIEGRRGPKNSEGYLATEETYTEFRVRGKFKMLGDGNYGLFYHSTITLRPNGYPDISGVQGEVMPGRPAQTGRLYESGRRGWLMDKDHEDVGSWALKEGEWNDIEIRSLGNRVTTWVNGIRVIDFKDPSPQVFEGSFALQLHTGEGAGIDWKDLWVKTEGLSAP